jgi:enterochelin esterase-like enzyme
MFSNRRLSVALVGTLVFAGCSTNIEGPEGHSGAGGHSGSPSTGGAGTSSGSMAGSSNASTTGGGSSGSGGGAGAPGAEAGTDASSGGSGGSPGTDGGAKDAGSDSDFPIGDPGTTGDGDFMIGPNYPMQPDLTDKGAPKGKNFHFTMNSADSMIFKGDDKTLLPQNQHAFTRGIDVYVPAQYKDGTPAPLLVIQDGPGEIGWVKNALDNLTISTDPMRKLPAFVAIAVQNGGGDSKGSERGLEYDTMSDRYARFIQTEVLPAVLANPQVKAAYPNLAFTDNPEGKATLGCSSGGAAALIMGWFRPDLFRRLITYSGTFVDQQDDDAAEEAMFPLGAWEFHSGLQLIANNPKKDLRVFLNVNDTDLGAGSAESGHHNWVMANQRTAAALKAKAYHDRFLFGQQAGHCQSNVRSSTLADTLVWAWRGYPVP